MPKRLLERQVSLLNHLTSSAAIFGGMIDTPTALHGIDEGLLHLEARFCYEKRMGKIAAVLPRTFELLGDCRDAIFHHFVAMYPPIHIGRLENARQFLDFLRGGGGGALDERAYIGDLAACELACGEVRNDVGAPEFVDEQERKRIRRSPGTILLRCSYDIRCFFEADPSQGAVTADPPRRETLLVVGRALDTDQPQIFEVIAPVFDLVAALDDWTDPGVLRLTPEAEALVVHLGRCGLIEAR